MDAKDKRILELEAEVRVLTRMLAEKKSKETFDEHVQKIMMSKCRHGRIRSDCDSCDAESIG